MPYIKQERRQVLNPLINNWMNICGITEYRIKETSWNDNIIADAIKELCYHLISGYKLNDIIDVLLREIRGVGDLNYVITYVCHKVLIFKGGIKYERICALISMLDDIRDTIASIRERHAAADIGSSPYELIGGQVCGEIRCAQFELYRIIAARYEDEKRVKNGPVSNLDRKSVV
jgi:hypothetical protein